MSSEHWAERIARALAGVSPDSLQLYADDDRLRLARRQDASEGRMRKAGVLIAIIDRPAPVVVFTERSQLLRSHPGQISFPGGSVEPGDADVQAAAIREAQEEIGLEPAHVRILGRLPDYVTGTGFDVAPFVAWLPADVRLAPDGSEVTRVFTVPLAYATERGNFKRDTIAVNNIDYRFHVLEYAGNYIWGATAAMLHGLCESLA